MTDAAATTPTTTTIPSEPSVTAPSTTTATVVALPPPATESPNKNNHGTTATMSVTSLLAAQDDDDDNNNHGNNNNNRHDPRRRGTTTTTTGGSSSGGGGSNKNSGAATTSSSVTMARKEVLLAQARRARLEWLRQVPLPWQQHNNNNNNKSENRTVVVQPLQRLQAVRYMPQALTLVESLYPAHVTSQHVQEVLSSAVGQVLLRDDKNDNSPQQPNSSFGGLWQQQQPQLLQNPLTLPEAALLWVTPEQERQWRLEQAEDDNNNSGDCCGDADADFSDRVVLQAYHELLHLLAQPEASPVVQGMRNFCRKFQRALLQQQQQQQATSNSKIPLTEPLPFPAAALWKSFSTYCVTTYDAILNLQAQQQQRLQQQAAAAGETQAPPSQSSFVQSSSTTTTTSLWSTSSSTTVTENMLRRSLESFLYGQCRSVCGWTPAALQRAEEWRQRWQAVQFITPDQLEIPCLRPYSVEYLRHTLLRPCVAILQSLERYHAPLEYLHRILLVYRSVNRALSIALNPPTAEQQQQQQQGTATSTTTTTTKQSSSSSSPKLPSADDVLPTLIYTLILAQPHRLFWYLQVVEELCPPVALRGEAGYAYTNLYGALQFVAELQLDLDTSENTSAARLHMSADEWAAQLAQCRARAQEQQQQQQQAMQEEEAQAHDDKEILASMAPPQTPPTPIVITPRQIRQARQTREGKLTLEWALQQQQQQQQQEPPFSTTELDGENGDEERKTDSTTTMAAAAAACNNTNNTNTSYQHPGRNYTFLGAEPHHITVQELPQLLEEYKQLVHTTEDLVAQRIAHERSLRHQQRQEYQEWNQQRGVQVGLITED